LYIEVTSIIRHLITMRAIFSAPEKTYVSFRFLDSLHGAIISAWCSAGVTSDSVVGRNAANWSFGAIGRATRKGFRLRTLVIGAEGELEPTLEKLEAKSLYKRSVNGDTLNLASWKKSYEPLPTTTQFGETAALPIIMLSPLALSVQGQKGRWHSNLLDVGSQLQEAVNNRLSRLTKRTTALFLEPDQLYLRANPKHSTLVHTRAVRGGRSAFVIGMMCPMIIRGPIADVKSAWNLGIGEKNRYGFGCIGHLHS